MSAIQQAFFMAIAAAGGDPTTDPDIASVVTLMAFDGSNGSTTFTNDIGTLTYTPTSATLTTSNKKYGTAAGNFRTNGARLTSSAGIPSGMAGDFTIEGWIYPTVLAISGICRWATNNRAIYLDGTGLLSWYNGSAFQAGSAIAASLNNWHHIAVCRSGTTIHSYLDGIKSATSSTDSQDLSTVFTVGGDAFNQELGGELDEFRITKGVCRYTANFTPRTTAFPRV